MLRFKTTLPALALVLVGGAFAQGDDCSSALAIGATGSFSFDTSANTTTGFDGGGSCAGGDDIDFDAFYQWTAPMAGDFFFITENSTFDTQISVHAGVGCAATCVAHDDDSGAGLTSSIFLTGIDMGDTFLIQVGGALGGQGAGMLHIIAEYCSTTPDDAFEDNDDCATATPMVDGTYLNLFSTIGDKDHYSVCVADGSTLDVDLLFVHWNGDLDLFLWDAADVNCGTSNPSTTALGSSVSVDDNESISWTNTTGVDVQVVVEVAVYSYSEFFCNVYNLVLSGSDCIIVGDVQFCDPAANNSTGARAVLAGTWGSGSGSGFHLEITGGVPGQLAYLLAGNEATVGIPVSNGLFCLAGTPTAQFFRFNVAGTDMNSIGGFDATGTMINAAGTSTTGFGFDVPSTIPAGPAITIMAGDTWHFQGWYRDAPAGVGMSNFTNGLSATF